MEELSVEITARHKIGQNFTSKYHRLYISNNMRVQSLTKYNTYLFKYKVSPEDQSSDRNKSPAGEDHRSCLCVGGRTWINTKRLYESCEVVSRDNCLLLECDVMYSDSDEHSGGIYCRHLHGKIVTITFHLLKVRRNGNLNKTNSKELCESEPKE